MYFADGQKTRPFNYQYVVNEPRSEYTEQSLARLSQILLDKKQ
jgi:hypothetical protein